MQQWEHAVVQLTAEEDLDWQRVVERLNRSGSDGWELVSYSFRPLVNIESGRSLGDIFMGAGAQVGAIQGETFAIFKRPLAG